MPNYPNDPHAQAARELIEALHTEREADYSLSLAASALNVHRTEPNFKECQRLAEALANCSKATNLAALKLAALVGRVLH